MGDTFGALFAAYRLGVRRVRTKWLLDQMKLAEASGPPPSPATVNEAPSIVGAYRGSAVFLVEHFEELLRAARP